MRRRKRVQETGQSATTGLAGLSVSEGNLRGALAQTLPEIVGTNRRAVAQPEGAGASPAANPTVIGYQMVNHYHQSVNVVVLPSACAVPGCTNPRNTVAFVHHRFCEPCLTDVEALHGRASENADWFLGGVSDA